LGSLLLQHEEAAGLAAFGGWNTAGNTLGSVLAQAVLKRLAERDGETFDQRRAHLELLFLRFLDDYHYQAIARTEAWLQDLPALGLNPTLEQISDPDREAALEQRLRRRLAQPAAALSDLFRRSGLAEAVEVRHVHLPWGRLFEIGFDVQVRLPW
jgi:hypothetical protein